MNYSCYKFQFYSGAATFHDFKLDGLEATEDGGITLPPFRFMFPLDFRFFYHQVDFTSQ